MRQVQLCELDGQIRDCMRQVQLCERDGQRESTSVKYTVNVMYKRERDCMRQVQLYERDVQRERVHASSTPL